MTVEMNHLDEEESFRKFRYHVRGLSETMANIAGLISRMDASYNVDNEQFAQNCTLLNVEAFEHLAYHLELLREPLTEIEHEAYAKIRRERPDQCD